mmetsp:Transcript_1141/g.2241  ORF Transcript_1141/g.2241 Transcript_1141/m.2241 type:complete len:816 (-) Transcript_1141:200-2647(-)|eukprot:CAMPEP_0201913352 /NCGR_PEP_ID=MMETSP0903-20130614/3807_1 /ASSEMBLY_ACC=CAM_ASM_000552 /TAXON_ID=420261 /ORGANISM="Thalassiosira antarctica, Strain CCMP982" /LENGTH=815 /DNA_ID=CAMNT_0048448527 /DNA_START=37 /DNA_END=2484 /DNA_ORIENTATION=+
MERIRTSTVTLWQNNRSRAFSAGSNGLLARLRQQNEKDIVALPEYKARSNLSNFLGVKAGRITSNASHSIEAPTPPPSGYKHILSSSQMLLTLDAAMATFHLHVESRIASLCGQGFYTIGPCGEEMLASIGHALDPDVDAMALHYRHLSVSILRQLRLGRNLEDVVLDRARGHVISKLDPVTGGVHCAIGSARGESTNELGGGDYVVTSTLASQCPPAVGRALGFSIADTILKSDTSGGSAATKPLSFVTIGDGSVHNAHFLSAFNLARHARFRKKKCPVVFGVSDNGLSISYPTDGYADYLFSKSSPQPLGAQFDPESRAIADRDGVPIFKANGCDMFDVYDKTLQATSYSRKYSAPSLILYQELTRRFGHAATDRQHAYLNADVVDRMAESDVVASGIVQAAEQWNAITYSEARDRFEEIGEMVKDSFDIAAEEPKITSRDEMLERVSQPMVSVPQLQSEKLVSNGGLQPKLSEGKREKREVMRKHMTRVVAEVMDKDRKVVYIGEDVEHGGYYLVTDGLVNKFPGRVIDFPPDETTLLGCAMGFSQVGLLPIIEVPYSKYLDCGADMFYEIAISNWLTNKQCPNGMVVRVQGFDRGVFGGNFHTHNMIPHIPPGVDVLCYSNGQDYARGFRNAIIQARNGRVVVLVDCTNLLNLRHLHEKDRGWETAYPADDEVMSFHDIRKFGDSGKHLIVTYGNGVVTALRARRDLAEQKVIGHESEIDIIDSPYISDIPDGLRDALSNGRYDTVLFCDICKEGPGSNTLSSIIMGLKKDGILPAKWDFVAAPRTYNPLGNMVTFLNEEDIIGSFRKLIC